VDTSSVDSVYATSAGARKQAGQLDNSSALTRLASPSKPKPRASERIGHSGWRTGRCLSAQAHRLRLRASARRASFGGGKCR